jgi:hypothetical protein
MKEANYSLKSVRKRSSTIWSAALTTILGAITHVTSFQKICSASGNAIFRLPAQV